VANAPKKIRLSGAIDKNHITLQQALPSARIQGTTSKFAFRKAPEVAGKEVVYDAQ